MSQVLGQIAAGNLFTLLVFDDGVVVDKVSTLITSGYSFGAIGGVFVGAAKVRHNKHLQETLDRWGSSGPVAVAEALKRGRVIPWSSVRSVTLTNKGKAQRILTITPSAGRKRVFRYLDRNNARYAAVTAMLAGAPGFTAEPPPS